MNKINIDMFSSRRADELKIRYNKMSENMARFCPMLNNFSEQLSTAVARFRQVDRTGQSEEIIALYRQ